MCSENRISGNPFKRLIPTRERPLDRYIAVNRIRFCRQGSFVFSISTPIDFGFIKSGSIVINKFTGVITNHRFELGSKNSRLLNVCQRLVPADKCPRNVFSFRILLHLDRNGSIVNNVGTFLIVELVKLSAIVIIENTGNISNGIFSFCSLFSFVSFRTRRTGISLIPFDIADFFPLSTFLCIEIPRRSVNIGIPVFS